MLPVGQKMGFQSRGSPSFVEGFVEGFVHGKSMDDLGASPIVPMTRDPHRNPISDVFLRPW